MDTVSEDRSGHESIFNALDPRFGCTCRTQTRALVTYIKRIYFPFILRNPHLSDPTPGLRCALWAYAEPSVAGTVAATECLGTALLIASLAQLPGALAALSQVVVDSGAQIRSDDRDLGTEP